MLDFGESTLDVGLVSKCPQRGQNKLLWRQSIYPRPTPGHTPWPRPHTHTAKTILLEPGQLNPEPLFCQLTPAGPWGTPSQPQNKHAEPRFLRAHLFVNPLTLTLKLSCSTPDNKQLFRSRRNSTPSPAYPTWGLYSWANTPMKTPPAFMFITLFLGSPLYLLPSLF